MVVKNWLTSLVERMSGRRFSHAARVTSRRRRGLHVRPPATTAEVLETRAMLTDFFVDTLSDIGQDVDNSPANNAFDGTETDARDGSSMVIGGNGARLSLREAIEIANRNQNTGNQGGSVTGDRIFFDIGPGSGISSLGGTIFLTSQLPTITDNVEIFARTGPIDLQEVWQSDLVLTAGGPATNASTFASITNFNGGAFVNGDVIQITGNDTTGTPVNVNFTVTDINTTTLGNLVTAISNAYSGATASIIGGRVTLTADLAGVQPFLSLNLTSNAGGNAHPNPLGVITEQTAGAGVIPITISGDVGNDNNEANNVRIFQVNLNFSNDIQDDVRIGDFTLENGNAQGANGGAIEHLGTGELYLTNLRFNSNQANGDGGAISLGGARAFITDSIFTSNRADADGNGLGGGGAIHQNGGLIVLNESSPGLTQTLLTGNFGAIAGAIHSANGTVIVNEGVLISGNGGVGTTQGGGLAIFGTRHSANVTQNENLRLNGTILNGASRVEISGNTATSGGGIYLGAGIRAYADNVLFANNGALGALDTQGGGAIFANLVSDVDILDSDFNGNSASGALGRGGAIHAVTTGGYDPQDLQDDTATDPDIFITSTTGTPTLQSQFRNNTAHSGGAIFVTGSGEVQLGGTNDIQVTPTTISPNVFQNFGGAGGVITYQNNRAFADGGAVYATGNGYVDIENPDMRNNVAGGLPGLPDAGLAGRGGAIFSSQNVLVDIDGGIITLNSAEGPTTGLEGGGAIYNSSGGTTGTGFEAGIDMFNVTVSNNTAIRGTANGGGIYNAATGLLDEFGSLFTTNTSAEDGGGIYNLGDFDSSSTTIEFNDSKRGAGIFNDGTFDATSIDIFGNEANEDGGGLYNDSNGVVDINDNTDVDGNDAYGALDGQGGAGIYNAGILFFQNSSLDDNGRDSFASTFPPDDIPGAGGISASPSGVDVPGNRIVLAGHRLQEGREIEFEPPNGGGVAPGGLSYFTVYYVRNSIIDPTNPNANSFQVSLTLGGPIITITDAGSVNVAGQEHEIYADLQPDDGGGILNARGGLATISNLFRSQNSTISNNEAVFGGGFHNRDFSSSLTIIDTEMRFNDADERGGAGEVRNGSVTLDDGVIQDNEAGSLLLFGLRVIEGSGGGVSNVGGTLLVQQTAFIRNTARFGGDGGGIFNDDLNGDNSTVTQVATATFTLNQAGGGGGGIYNNAVLFVSSSSLNANRANGGDGGGLLNTANGVADVLKGVFSGNFAAVNGGGVSNQDGVITLDALQVNGNIAAQNGGGLYLNGAGSLTFRNGQFNDNVATNGSGGGIWTAGSVNLDNVRLSRNRAGGNLDADGGGAIFLAAGGTSAVINKSQLTFNTALGTLGDGGAILAGDDSIVTITDSTLSNNSATRYGGAIESNSNTLTITNSKLDDNKAGTFPTTLAAGDVVIIGFRATDATAANDDDFEISWVPLVDIQPGQSIFFTDRGWNSTTGAFNTAANEGFIRYTAPSTGLAAGTVMRLQYSVNLATGVYTFNPTSQGQPGTYDDPTGANDALRIAVGGENLFVFGGSIAAPNFLFGLTTDRNPGSGFDAVFVDDEVNTTLPPALMAANAFVELGDTTNFIDNARYNQTTTGTKAFLLANLNNRNNWDKKVALPFTPNPGVSGSDSTNGVSEFDVTDQQEADGGAIHVTGDAIVSITGGSISRNMAADDGGGVYNSATGTVTVTNTILRGNVADRGAGLFQATGPIKTGSLTVNTSEISGGIANDDGGGLFVEGARLTVNTSTISGNSVTGNGGGIAQGPEGILDVRSSTITLNNALGTGGGIFNDPAAASVTLRSTIVSGNTAGTNPDASGSFTGNYNLIGSSTGFVPIAGPNNRLDVDPLLGALADNGFVNGPRTHALQVGSPALDTGIDAAGLGKDQRGERRPFVAGNPVPPGGDSSDIGAFESQIPLLSLIGLNNGNTLVVFDERGPGSATSVAIVGLQGPSGTFGAELVLALDARVEDHALYGVTNRNNIYRINPVTGQATFVSSMTVGINDLDARTLDQTTHFYYSNGGLSENFLGLGEKWIRGEDSTAVGNAWYYVTPDGNLFKWDGLTSTAGDVLIATLGSNVYHELDLLVDAFDAVGALTAGELTAIQNADQSLRLFKNTGTGFDYDYNFLGVQDKWLRGISHAAGAGVTPATNPDYFIILNGAGMAELYAWDGTRNGATTVANSMLIGTFNRAIYDDPTILAEAYVGTLTLAQQAEALNRDTALDFHYARDGRHYIGNKSFGPQFVNFLGRNEKWFRGNGPNGTLAWFFIEPTGAVYAASNLAAPLFQAGADAWDNLDLIVNAATPAANLTPQAMAEARRIDFENRLFRSTDRSASDSGYYFNTAGQKEKWLVGKVNAFGNRFYIITVSDNIIAWNGQAGINGTLLGNVAGAYRNPEVLYQAYDRTATLGTTALPTLPGYAADFSNVATTIEYANTVVAGRPVDDSLRFFVDGIGSINFQIDVDSGLTEIDGNLAVPRSFRAAAFDQNVDVPGTPPTLYAIDFDNDVLVTLNPETGQVVTTIGPLNLGLGGGDDAIDGGLEILTVQGQQRGVAAIRIDLGGGDFESRLYDIDLTTGMAREIPSATNGLIGALNAFEDLTDLALNPRLFDEIFGPIA